jgi:glutamate racemase
VPDSRPIGVFDSGVGGLTVLLTLQEMLPGERTIYLGDLARFPYGPRPQSQVRDFAVEIADFLAASDIKLLVVACNTATAAAYPLLRDRYSFPVVGVVDPGAAEAARVSESGRIGVVATDGTVSSQAYSRAIQRCRPDAVVIERPASWLVPVIESGTADEAEILARLEPIMRDMHESRVDTLILGCTHFPLLRHLFEVAAGPDIALLDSATTTSREVRRLLAEFNLQSGIPPEHRILVTGPAASFAGRVATMFHAYPPIETVELSSGLLDAREAG